MGPLPPPQHSAEVDQFWLYQSLEETTANLRDLHVMRQEAEKRVREALQSEPRLQVAELGLKGTDTHNLKKAEVVRCRRSQSSETPDKGAPQAKVLPEQISKARPGRTRLTQVQYLRNLLGQDPNDLDISGKFPPERILEKWVTNDFVMSQHKQDAESIKHHPTEPAPRQEVKQRRIKPDQDRVRYRMADLTEENANHEVRYRKTPPEELERARYFNAEPEEQNHNPLFGREIPLPTPHYDHPSLNRIGSGSWVPRLRLGSSGVTSDLLFTRRMSGKCLSTPSSGFYEASDLDSASSCSSLCSDISSTTTYSLMSPQRSTALRPRSIDCTTDRRRELQSTRGGTQRPMSAGALDSSLLSIYPTQNDSFTHKEDTSQLEFLPAPPPLSVIHQRWKTERYICKLALHYRCRPGTSSLPPDLGPPLHKSIQILSLHSESPHIGLPSPQCFSSSTSVCDLRKMPKGYGGSWGRFISRVLRRDSRTAASEMHLEQCGREPYDDPQKPQPIEGQLSRAKSFRDLLSAKRFKAWQFHS
ncbi:uncharacterized protein LOC128636204 [Bombina bombina]|uniref:uncharacterized protein LOC128636204 n=1 Tax=Bombina bombina TaxID=8345 RepID=UPI00235A625E|nr:uncharacterized protein LOC128636204 [Bombina bombina]